MTVPSGATLAEGMANTSHQIRLVCGGCGPHAPVTDQVALFLGSRKHCRFANGLFGSFSIAGSVTYRGTAVVVLLTGSSTASSWPVFGSTRFWLGSNTSGIWNGLMWMWNG